MRSLYRSGLFTTEARELATYKLDLVCVLEFRWDKGGTVKTDDYKFIYVKRNQNLQLETEFLYTTEYHQQLRQQSITDRTSCRVLRSSWCDIIVLKAHAAAAYESDDSNDRFLRN